MFFSFLTGLIFLLAAIGYGLVLQAANKAVFSAAPLPAEQDERVLLAFGVGAWLICHLVLGSGLAGFLSRLTLTLILLPGLAGLLLFFRMGRSAWGPDSPAARRPIIAPAAGKSLRGLRWPRDRITLRHALTDGFLPAAALFLILLALAGALTPAVQRDSLLYHLALPKLFLEQGRWLEIPQNIFGYYPGFSEALYTLTLGFGSNYPAVLHWIFGLACFSATLALGRFLGLRWQFRLLAATALLACPTFWLEMTWPYADLITTFYWLMAILCFFHWRQEKTLVWLVLLGFSIGAANGAKFTSLILLFILPLALLTELRQTSPLSLPKTGAVLLVPILTGVLTASPWWIRNIIWTHNPFFPFFLNLFPSVSPEWDSGRAALYHLYLDSYGGFEKNWLQFLLAPFKIFTSGRLDEPLRYDGILGPYFLLFWPVLAFWRRLPATGRYLGGLVLIYLTYWTLSSQQARFLLVILPAASLLIGWLLQTAADLPAGDRRRLSRRTVWRYLGMIVVAGLLTFNYAKTVSLFSTEGYAAVLGGEQTKEEYLREKLAYYDIYCYINDNLAQDVSLFLVMTGNQGYYLDRHFFSDAVFESHTFTAILQSAGSVPEISAALKKRGWTHLLIRPDFFLRERQAELSSAELARFNAFLNRQKLLKMTGPFLLFELRS